MLVSMLTTVDNPFNPFDDYDEWYAFDTQYGYHTPGYLARTVKLSDELSDVDIHLEIERAIDSIIELNWSGNYRKVTKEIPD